MKERANIILITVDQMRRDCMGVSGHPDVQTPNLDMMKRNGFMFNKAYSAVPSCIASRAALLTGLSQTKHGRVGYKDGICWNYEHTIASEFTKAGYQTQAVGKMHVYPERNLLGFHNVILHDGYLHFSRNMNRSANSTFAQVDDYLYWLKKEKGIGADIIDSGIECNSWVARPFPYDEEYHPTNWCAMESIDFLRRRDPSKPFFLYTSFVRPHAPLDPPSFYMDMYSDQDLQEPFIGDWVDKDDKNQDGLQTNALRGIIPKGAMHRARAAYYGHISHIDNQIGKMLQALTDYQLLNNTVILFTSDHGDLLGDHNLFRKALPYEGSVGVPLLLYDPGNVLNLKQNKSIDTLIELRDIMPTLLDLAEIEIPSQIDGKSFKNALSHEEFGIHDYLHGEHEFGEFSNHFVVTKSEKYCWFSQTGIEQFFDLANDPHELENKINDVKFSQRVENLRGKLINELMNREEGYVKDSRLVVGQKASAILEVIYMERIKSLNSSFGKSTFLPSGKKVIPPNNSI